MLLGEQLRAARKERGLTLKQLSELSGVHDTYISQIENGKVISTDTLDKLLEALNKELKIVNKQ